MQIIRAPLGAGEEKPVAEDSREVSINFHIPDGFRTLYATNLVVQHTKHEFIITFFEVLPPLLLGTPEMKTKQLDSVREIQGSCLARIAVPATRMEEFVQVLSDNLKTFKETPAEQRQG